MNLVVSHFVDFIIFCSSGFIRILLGKATTGVVRQASIYHIYQAIVNQFNTQLLLDIMLSLTISY